MRLRCLFSLVLYCLKREVVQFNLSGIQSLGVLQKAAIKLCTSRNLPDRPPNTNAQCHLLCSLIALFSSEVRFLRSLPVLVDEALILALRIDGRHSRRYLPVDSHHLMMEKSGDVEILLQNLLTGSAVREGQSRII